MTGSLECPLLGSVDTITVRDRQLPTYAVAIAPVHRHSASGSVREIGAASIILGERQHLRPTMGS